MLAGGLGFILGPKIQHVENIKHVEMRMFGEDGSGITVSNRLYKPMRQCADSGGFVSVVHTSFDSELVCYNGQEYILESGVWTREVEETL